MFNYQVTTTNRRGFISSEMAYKKEEFAPYWWFYGIKDRSFMLLSPLLWFRWVPEILRIWHPFSYLRLRNFTVFLINHWRIPEETTRSSAEKIPQEYTLTNAEGQVMLLHWLMTNNAATMWNTLYPTITYSHKQDNWPQSSIFKSLKRWHLELFWFF